MRFTETINGYNAMEREDAEYEACYTVTEHHTISGLHCHDFYEFYIHYQGGKVYYVDGSVFPLQNNQLIIMPPFRMHGLVGGSSLQNYERGFLYLRRKRCESLASGRLTSSVTSTAACSPGNSTMNCRRRMRWRANSC